MAPQKPDSETIIKQLPEQFYSNIKQMREIIDVREGRLRSAYVENLTLAKSLIELSEKGYEFISIKQNLELYIQERLKESSALIRGGKGNRTKEAFLYWPDNQRIIITKSSPAIQSPENFDKTTIWSDADILHPREFYLTDDQINYALSNSISLSKREIGDIPTKRLGDDELTAFLLEEKVKQIRGALRELDIKSISFPTLIFNRARDYSKPFLRQFWVNFFSVPQKIIIMDFHCFGQAFTTVRGVKYF